MIKNVSLVLSGGGARGIAHIGVIEELIKREYNINAITGTSMGALVGATYALGEIENFKTWICSLDRRKVFQLVDFSLGNLGLVKGERVLNKMKEFIPDKNIEDLPMPYAAVAVDLLKQEEVVIRTGSVFEAIRASISIPTVFTPVKKNDQLLVDGGLLNNIPVTHAPKKNKDLLFAVDVNAIVPLAKPKKPELQEEKEVNSYLKRLKEFNVHLQKIIPQQNNEDNLSYFDLMSKTIGIMTHRIAQSAVDKNPPDLMINISREASGTYDFFKASELIEIGRYAAQVQLDAFEKNRKDVAAIAKNKK